MTAKKDFTTFIKRNWRILLAIVYLLSPIDILPDFIAGLGISDDILVLLATLFIEYRRYTKEKKEHAIQEGELIGDEEDNKDAR